MESATTPIDQPDYAGLLRRQWRVVAALSVIGLLLGVAAFKVSPSSYMSTASVLVQSINGGGNGAVANGRTTGDLNLDTEAQLVKSTSVAARVKSLLGTSTSPRGLVSKVAVQVPANTSVLQISFTARSAAKAAAGAHAFAEAYLQNRKDSALSDVDQQVSGYETQIKALQRSLQKVNNQLGGSGGNSASRLFEEQQRSSLTNQINALTGHVNDLQTSTIIPGQIIADALPPSAPSGPSKVLYLMTGLLFGLLVGLAVAALRHRLDTRLRSVRDIEREGMPILGTLPAALPADAIRSARPAASQAVRQLSNVVATALTAECRTLVISGISADTTAVVSNLAIALSQSGLTMAVICVGTQSSRTPPLLVAHEQQGLSEVLRRRLPVQDALQAPEAYPGLLVMAPGINADSIMGRTGPAAVAPILKQAREAADVVIVQTPSIDETHAATAQMFAGVADAAILVVELESSRREGLTGALTQYGRVGAQLLGLVVLEPSGPAHGTRPAAILQRLAHAIGGRRRDGAAAPQEELPPRPVTVLRPAAPPAALPTMTVASTEAPITIATGWPARGSLTNGSTGLTEDASDPSHL